MRHSPPTMSSARRNGLITAAAGLVALLALFGLIALEKADAGASVAGAGLATEEPVGAKTVPATAVPDIPVQAATPTPAAPDPTRLIVDALDIDIPIEPEGIDPDGTMGLPESGEIAGWYRYGPAPGDDAGTTILASHVDTYDGGLGEFSRLTKAKPGDAVTVTDTDGINHNYTVETVEQTDKDDVPLDALFNREGDRKLVMVTCGGRWDSSIGHYDDNVIVTAVPQN